MDVGTYCFYSGLLNEIELNLSIKKLFLNSHQLQITIDTSEDFDLLKPETGKEYLNRFKKAIDDVEKKRNVVTISDVEVNEMVLSRL